MELLRFDSFTIIIGKNAKNNWEILDNADSEDIWLHLDDLPSPYVIIKHDPNYKLKRKNIKLAGRLCRDNSKYKTNKNITVCYIKVKYVKKGTHLGEAELLKDPSTIIIK
jgi:predicted ribosome quality control (RQC) complex YloA/Tae2 family protein